MPDVSLVGVAADAATTTATVSYASLGSVQPTDRLVAVVALRGTGADIPDDITTPSGWTFHDALAAAEALEFGVYSALVGGDSSVDWTRAGNDGIYVAVGAYRNADQSTVFDVAPLFNSPGSFPPAQEPPDLTTTTDGAMACCNGTAPDNRGLISLSPDQGFTLDLIFDSTVAGDASIYLSHKALTTAGAQTAPSYVNGGGGVSFYGVSYAVMPASAPDPPGPDIGGADAGRIRSPRYGLTRLASR